MKAKSLIEQEFKKDELTGVSPVICSWCKTTVGEKPARASEHGKPTHTICEPCKDKVVAGIKKK